MSNHARLLSSLHPGPAASLSPAARLSTAARCFRAALFLPLALLFATGCRTARTADVIATVNAHPILQADLDKAYAAWLRQNQQQEQPSSDQADSTRLQILQGLILEEIVEERAMKLNLAATDAEVDAKVAEAKAPYTEEQFQASLRASGRTLDDIRHDFRRSLTLDKLLNKEINSKITVTDSDVNSYFNAHKAEFNLIETRYHLAQIQVTSIPTDQANNLQGSKATNDLEAKKKIQALQNRLQSGEDFGALAMNFSENPDTAPNGGDMGFFYERELRAHPDVYTAIMKLKPGQITDILPLMDLQTRKPVGYAIYKFLSREPAGQREINDPTVQQAIRQQLHDGRAQLLKNAYFEMLRDQAKIVNFYAENIFKNDAH
jgi:peptidyl-prolyl cis-trans isomerase SurA